MSDAILKRLREMHAPNVRCTCPVCSVERTLVHEIERMELASEGDRAAAAVHIILKAFADQLRYFTPESREEVIGLANKRLLRAAEILDARAKSASQP